MTGRTHDAIGFSVLVVAASYYPPSSLTIYTLFGALVGNVVGSYLPDIDQATNRLWDMMPLGEVTGRVFRNLFLKHRTITHSLLGLFIFYKFLEFILPKIFNSGFIDSDILLISIIIGYVAHLAADSVTTEGLPLFFPLPFKIGFPPFKFLRISTGGFWEKYVVLPGVAIFLILFINKQAMAITQILRNISY